MRPTASIVIPAWNEWELTRACLESLRPTLGLRDQVVVVDNGSADGTAAGLRRYSWVTVVSHPENLGFAGGCNSGAAVATGDSVVFLNNDTLVPSRWLDGLLAPFADPTVGATGPRSNFVSGPQLVESVPYHAGRMAQIQSFARTWRQENRGATSEVTRLVGFCLAVRRELLEELGGFDEGFGLGGYEDDDLCLRIAAAGRRLLITHESFVHHHGHRTFDANGVDWFALQQENGNRLQDKHNADAAAALDGGALVSACLIVKDEEDNLPGCLASLMGLVDEVVVYDTGSTDATVALARAAGAKVVEGYWDDDFGRARNSALEHCTGHWVLHVDADERVQGDADALRVQLQALPAPGTIQVHIDNVDDDGSLKFAHTANRLFQRLRGHWEGRLHEQVIGRDGSKLSAGSTEHVRIRHSGYTDESLTTRNKHDRNLRVARAASDATGGTDPQALLNLARALTATASYDEAVAVYERARAATTDTTLLRHVLRACAEALLDAGRPTDALPWIAEFRTRTTSSTMPDFLEGTAHLALGDTTRALALLESVAEARDEDFTVAPRLLHLRRGLSLADAERWAEASTDLTAAVVEHGVAAWGQLLRCRRHAGLPVGDLVAGLPESREVSVMAQALLVDAAAADPLVEALWADRPGDPRLLAFALQIAPRLGLERALEWSARLRTAGLADSCPLVTIAGSTSRTPLTRLRAAAVAFGAFADDRGEAAVRAAAAHVEVADMHDALLLLDSLAPALLPALLTGAATTPARCFALAEVLAALGADEQAQALREHAAA